MTLTSYLIISFDQGIIDKLNLFEFVLAYYSFRLNKKEKQKTVNFQICYSQISNHYDLLSGEGSDIA